MDQNPRQKFDPRYYTRVIIRRGYSYLRPAYVVHVGAYSYWRGRGRKQRRVYVHAYKYTRYEKIIIPPKYEYRQKKVVEKPTNWLPVQDYQKNLEREYELVQSDPIYRFDYFKDVIETGDLFVWDQPLRRDASGLIFPKAVFGFRGVRVWFLVEQTNTKKMELWARSVLSGFGVTTYADLLTERDRLVTAFQDEVEKLEYIELVSLAAWTAYTKIKNRQGRSPLTRSVAGGPGQEIMPSKVPGTTDKKHRHSKKKTTKRGRSKTFLRRRRAEKS